MAAKHISGNLDELRAVNGVSKAGKPYTKYIGYVGEDKIDFGFNKPKLNEGDFFDETCEFKYGAWQPGGSASNAASTPRRSAPRAETGGNVQFPVPATDKGTSICRQNALGHAVQLVCSFTDSGLSLDEAADLTIRVAEKLADFSTGQREVKAVKRQVEEYGE